MKIFNFLIWEKCAFIPLFKLPYIFLYRLPSPPSFSLPIYILSTYYIEHLLISHRTSRHSRKITQIHHETIFKSYSKSLKHLLQCKKHLFIRDNCNKSRIFNAFIQRYTMPRFIQKIFLYDIRCFRLISLPEYYGYRNHFVCINDEQYQDFVMAIPWRYMASNVPSFVQHEKLITRFRIYLSNYLTLLRVRTSLLSIRHSNERATGKEEYNK